MGNTVLQSTRFLVENPSYVRINHERLEEFAEMFSKYDLTLPAYDYFGLPEGTDNTVIDFFVLINTINFAYVDLETKKLFKTFHNGKEINDYAALCVCFKRSLEEGMSVLEGEFLKDISEDDLDSILSRDSKIHMFEERLDILREVGQVLCEKYDGHFHNILAESNNRLFNNGTGFVERLINDFPSFDDSVQYQGKLARFDKRAQLAGGMLYGRFKNAGIDLFEDVDELTVFADYILPREFRDLGVFVYEDRLAERIDLRMPVLSESDEELEMRAGTVHTGKGFVDGINKYRNDKEKINSIHADSFFWSFSRNGEKERLSIESTPHHLTKTIAY
ncbi:hypothetical protein HQ533_03255 [Candidatus Woesearchaeota archaeon]|nr:hypothetical protein [Candidatus Woesearchaeota archaeon]